MIKILIAEDSPTDCAILKHLFESEEDMTVVGCATNGKEAVEMVEKLKPDIITMDIKMPIMDGYQATEMIMSKFPTPIVVISSMVSDSDSDATFRSLEAGALTVLPKPIDIRSPAFQVDRRYMLDTIRSMVQIKVITRRRLSSRVTTDGFKTSVHGDYRLVAIGASVGGPQALRELISRLPSNFPLPIVVVQHMTTGFLEGFVKWLDTHVDLKVKYAENGEILKPGEVYFAPDHNHLEISANNHSLQVSLNKGAAVAGFCPSITVLMQSVARNCGSHAIGVLMTGMGSDGADGMLALKKAGSHTVIQDQASCVVFGMARVAQSLGAVDKMIDLDKMAEYLIKVTNKKRG